MARAQETDITGHVRDSHPAGCAGVLRRRSLRAEQHILLHCGGEYALGAGEEFQG